MKFNYMDFCANNLSYKCSLSVFTEKITLGKTYPPVKVEML